jgi:urease accessory protein
MGAATARITAQEFLTPPELADWPLAANAAGRIGGVRLELLDDAGGTCLGQCYQQVPLRVMPPFRFGRHRASLLYLLNPTAGLMDGDGQLVHLIARRGSKAVVTGQSATRIHPSVQGFCTQQWEVRVEPQAILVALPGPAIPFQGCRYYQRVNIHLEEGAGLIWGDLWFAGRYARGDASERFQFNTIIQDLTVKRQGKLVFRDRFCWRGPWDDQTAAWHFGLRRPGKPEEIDDSLSSRLPHSACGSLFVTESVEESCLPSCDDLEWGLFPTAERDTCIRFLGSSDKVTKALVRTALGAGGMLSAAATRRQDLSAPPGAAESMAHRAGPPAEEPWLWASHDLAPNHWFHCGQASDQESAVRNAADVTP